jgi:hypothetical protein
MTIFEIMEELEIATRQDSSEGLASYGLKKAQCEANLARSEQMLKSALSVSTLEHRKTEKTAAMAEHCARASQLFRDKIEELALAKLEQEKARALYIAKIARKDCLLALLSAEQTLAKLK